MNTRYLIIGLLTGLLLAIGMYFHYQHQLRNRTPDIWSFVPESAIIVYESDNIWEDWHNIEKQPLWNILSSVSFFKQISENIVQLDSLTGNNISLEQFFSAKSFLFSAHVTSKDALDYLYYFPIRGAEQHALVQDVIKSFRDQPHVADSKRVYNGYNIFELTDKNSDTYFSYIIYKNYFVGSFTPFLVEDVIRNIDPEQDTPDFRTANPEVFNGPQLVADEGNLYVNTNKLPLFFSTFVTSQNTAALHGIGALCNAMFLDIKFGEQDILLNGFSTSEPGGEQTENLSAKNISLLETFAEQMPEMMTLQDYIPEETALLYHFTFDDPLLWQKQLYKYLQQHRKHTQQLAALKTGTTDQFQTSSADIFEWFSGEIGLSVMESVDVTHPDLLLLINVTDTADALHALQRLDNEVNDQADHEMYNESFGDYTLRELDYDEFPAHLLGPLFAGFDRCFFTFSEHYFLMANDIDVLKRVLLGRTLENTWSKSVKQSVFLESIIEKANFSLIINTARTWEMLKARLSPKWQQYLEEYNTQIRAFDQVALQFSNLDDQFYTSLALKYKPMEAHSPERSQFVTVRKTFTEQPLSAKPYVVRSHTHQNFETLLHDANRHLSLISPEGEMLWQDSLPGPIISDVQQVDFYNNGKLQYFFATPTALHIIDRNGETVGGYPLFMPENVKIEWVSLIDYDNSKRYRFLVADTQGNLYMFDKDKENLEGWTPLALGSRLSSPPFHLRIRGNDFIIAIEESGKINVITRRGEYYSGFPLALNDKVYSPPFVKTSADPAHTELTVVTESGEITIINLRGEVISKEQLYRPSTETTFRLCVDGLGKTYVIARQDFNKLSILSRKGTLIFEKNYISEGALQSGQLSVQYYDFGAGNEIYAVTDKIQEFTYLYDGEGELYNDRPIESGFEIGLIYYEQENLFRVYRNYGKEFSIISLPN